MEIVCHTARRSHCYGLNRGVHCLVGFPRWSCFEPIARTIKQASSAPLSAAVQSGKRRSHIADHLNCGPPRRRKIPLARDRHRDRECSLRTAGHTRHVLMSSRTAPSKRASREWGRTCANIRETPRFQPSPCHSNSICNSQLVDAEDGVRQLKRAGGATESQRRFLSRFFVWLTTRLWFLCQAVLRRAHQLPPRDCVPVSP
jgi:hypothetical protein